MEIGGARLRRPAARAVHEPVPPDVPDRARVRGLVRAGRAARRPAAVPGLRPRSPAVQPGHRPGRAAAGSVDGHRGRRHRHARRLAAPPGHPDRWRASHRLPIPARAWRCGRAEFREYVRLAVPRAVAQPIEAITFLFFTSVASGMAAGSVSSVSFARNFQSVPVSLIGIAFSVAAFPVLSRVAATGDRAAFARLVREQRADHRGPEHAGGHRAGPRGRSRHPACCSAARRSMTRTSR